jgi:hypothetical protein
MIPESSPEMVFRLWCRLTGTDAEPVDIEEREAFWARPQMPDLVGTPYPVLLEAGVAVARRGSLPLERWLTAVRTVRPHADVPR